MKPTLLEDIIKLAGLRSLNEDERPIPSKDVSPIYYDSNVDFDRLDPDLKQAFTNAAQDYYKDTGKRVPVTSAFRSKEYNDMLRAAWKDPVQRAKHGLIHEPAEFSHHIGDETGGHAIDSPSALEMIPYLQAHGLHVPDPEGDPVHIEKMSAPQQAQKFSQTQTPSPQSVYSPKSSEPGPRGIPHITSAVTPVTIDPVKNTNADATDVLDQFAKLNNIRDITKTIQPGDKFKLPDGSDYTVGKGDNIWNIAHGKFKGTTSSATPPVSMPSTISPDTEKPIKTPEPDTPDSPEVQAAKNRADMDSLKAQGIDAFEPSKPTAPSTPSTSDDPWEKLRQASQNIDWSKWRDPGSAQQAADKFKQDQSALKTMATGKEAERSVPEPEPSALDKFSSGMKNIGSELGNIFDIPDRPGKAAANQPLSFGGEPADEVGVVPNGGVTIAPKGGEPVEVEPGTESINRIATLAGIKK